MIFTSCSRLENVKESDLRSTFRQERFKGKEFLDVAWVF